MRGAAANAATARETTEVAAAVAYETESTTTETAESARTATAYAAGHTWAPLALAGHMAFVNCVFGQGDFEGRIQQVDMRLDNSWRSSTSSSRSRKSHRCARVSLAEKREGQLSQHLQMKRIRIGILLLQHKTVYRQLLTTSPASKHTRHLAG